MTLGKELEQRKTAEKAPDVFALLERQKPAIEKVLGGTMATERFARIVTTELRRNPTLGECHPASILGAVMVTAQLGLEPGPLGLVYLVPYKREATVIVGYKGYVELAYRSGHVKDVYAELVHDGDAFAVQRGTSPKITHVPAGAPGDRPIVAAYAVARLRSGGTVSVALYEEDWQKARAASALGKSKHGPWAEHFPAMVRKTAIRRLSPWLPKTEQLGEALEQDEAPAPPLEEGEAA